MKRRGRRGGGERARSGGSRQPSSAPRAAQGEDEMREEGKGKFYFSRLVERGCGGAKREEEEGRRAGINPPNRAGKKGKAPQSQPQNLGWLFSPCSQ